MDEIVKAALKKWPNVPHCRGWLGLDARGRWWLRDASAQSAGPFPEVKGSLIEHEKLRDFIERNYEHDADGCWFFQNGPQRVYVELEAAPWIWRLQAPAGGADAPAITGQGGKAARFESAWVDQQGRLFLACDLGLGLVHSLDADLAADAIERGQWALQESTLEALAERFGVCLSPAARAAPAPEAGAARP